MLVALKLDDGIDDMFQNLGTCQGSFLGDMTNQNDGYPAGLGEAQQGSGTFTHLGNAAGRALDVLCRDGLDGVDDNNLRFHLLDMVEDGLQGVLAENQEVIISG